MTLTALPAPKFNGDELSARVNAATAYLRAAPAIGTTTYLTLSEAEADAAANSAAINAALAAVDGMGRAVVISGQSIPLASEILLPAAGNYHFLGRHGAELRPMFTTTTGCIRNGNVSAPMPTIENVHLEGLHVRPLIDPATGLPYTGRGFYFNLTGSDLNDLRVEGYWGAQGFWGALYDSVGRDWRAYTESTEAGAGGIRLVGGEDSQIWGVDVRSGDDGIQFVPSDNASSAFYNWPITNCHYRGGKVESYARAMIALCDANVTSHITGCGFDGIAATVLTGPSNNRSVSVGSQNATGRVRGLTMRGTVDERLRSMATHFTLALDGAAHDCDIDLTVTAPLGGLASISANAGTGLPPTRTRLRLRNDRPSVLVHAGVSLTGGDRITIEPHLHASGSHGISITGGTSTRIRGGHIVGLASGLAGVRDTGGTKTDIEGTHFSGAGNSYSFTATPASTARVMGCDLGGMAAAGTAPPAGNVVNNRA